MSVDRPAGPPGMTRRTFLQCGTGGALLLVAGRWLPGCAGSESPSSAPPVPEPDARHAVGVILAVPALCGACGRCALTCSALHGDGPGAAHALTGPDAIYQQLQFSSPYWAAATCHMCPETHSGDGTLTTPACVASCPRGAARIAEAGHPLYGDARVRYIDLALCDGCGLCHERCPYHHPLLDGGKAHKCDLCRGRFPAPPCAESCPSRALRWTTPWAAAVADPFDWVAAAAAGGGVG